jgi:hypothetical protein
LEYFTAIWYILSQFGIHILSQFGIFCGNFDIFSRFGVFGTRKIWQPWFKAQYIGNCSLLSMYVRM